MKPLQTPKYAKKSTRHEWHQVPGRGLCPTCGAFGHVMGTQTSPGFKIQRRKCAACGENFDSIIRLDNGNTEDRAEV